jgi:hypothetical protein
MRILERDFWDWLPWRVWQWALMVLMNIARANNLILRNQVMMYRKEVKIEMDMKRLTEDVAKIKGVVESGVAVITTLAAEVRENKDDPAKLEILCADLEASAGKMAEAIATVPVEEKAAEEPAPEKSAGEETVAP